MLSLENNHRAASAPDVHDIESKRSPMQNGVVESLTLEPVPAKRRPILENLMQLYLHDFSEFAEVGSNYGEVGPDGRFAHEGLDGYWSEEGSIPFLFRSGGRLAGFALLNRWSALDRPLDHSVAEFFVLRKYRRIGTGRRAAQLLFESRRGRWEVPVAGYNQPALAFWRHTIPAVVAQTVEEAPGDADRWSGTVFGFDNRA